MATAAHHEPATAPALLPFARLPYGPQHKDGPWTTGCVLLTWALGWAWLSGFAATPNGWLVLAAFAALALSAPHAWRWMRDGVAPPPDPGHASLLFEKGLGLWLLRLVVWRIPSVLADLVVTTVWNLAGGRRAARAWRRQAAGLDPVDPAVPVPRRGGGRARRAHPGVPGAGPDTAEHRRTRGPQDGWPTTDEHDRPSAAHRADGESTFSGALRDAFPEPERGHARERRWRRAARWAQLVRDDDAGRD